jgi:uncharacterized protein YjbI with pentapeptide repeats
MRISEALTVLCRFSDSDMRGADFREADLKGAEMWRVSVKGCVIAPDLLHHLINCRMP